ncbi:MAG: PP2C family protein-serine/threonine phosphatase, partial [Desulfobacterales bacterium]
GLLLDARFAVSEVELLPGEILLAYTDGIPEARNPQGKMFTRDRVLQLLATPPHSVEALLAKIDTAVRDHISVAGQFDDITLLAAQRLIDGNSKIT